MQNFVSKKLSWFMIFFLTFMWSGIIEYKAFAQQRTELSPEELKQMADKLEKWYPVLEEVIQELSRDSFDPEAIIKKVNNDPIKLFEWVRENTYLVPYRGSLRGPIGVLMDRMGNSLDRALLLHEFLRLAGHKVKLVYGTLTKEQALQVMEKIRSLPKVEKKDTLQFSSQEIDNLSAEYAIKYQFDRGQVSRLLKRMIQEQRQLEEKITKRVRDQAEAIHHAVEKFQEDQKNDEEDSKLIAVQDHWWVQLEKDDTWLDLDPTMPHAEPGEALIDSDGVFKPDDLKDDLLHTVVIRVVVEQWKNGALKENKVLEHVFKPSELFGERIMLRHIPMTGLEEFNIFKEKDFLPDLKDFALKQKEWLPVLNLGSKEITACSFNDSGEINDIPGKKMTGGVAAVSRGIFSPLAGKEEEKTKSHLTAEWVEYEIRVPGESVRKIRREIFDLLGSAKRSDGKIPMQDLSELQRLNRSLAVMGETEILIQVCQLSADFVAYLMAKNLLANQNILPEIFRHSELRMHEKLANQARNLTPLPGPEYVLALVRHEWSRTRDDVYLDRPNILNYFWAVRLNPQRELIAQQGFDIIANEVAVHSNSKADPFQVRLNQGVLDTNAEALIMGSSGEPVENAAELFAKARVQGVEWLTIRDANDPNWERVELPTDIRIRIEQDLSQGFIVLVPMEAIEIESKLLVGWWKLNPQNGNILGAFDSSRGQAAVTYKILLQGVAFSCGVFALIGSYYSKKHAFIFCALGALLAPLYFYVPFGKGIALILIFLWITGFYPTPW